MAEYLKIEDLDAMSMALNVYDLDQHGWEHERKGLEFNLKHTLEELVRAQRKDFYDESVVYSDLAPDAMQYALRIARWTGFKNELSIQTPDMEYLANHQSKLMRSGTRRIGAYAVSQILLSDYLHKLDHKSERRSALADKHIVLPRVSQALIVFALDSANEFMFKPRNAFFNRLSDLRERFGIPQTN